MSRPPNILSTFRSHSYYHVLVMCDSTSTAEKLATSPDLNVWSRAKDGPSGVLGKWTPNKVPNHDGQYSILIHGAVDADLGIDSYKLTSYTAASATAGDKNTSLATEGEIVITEPKGVIFFDLLVRLRNVMKVDASSSCFMIKTFFVGHADDPYDGEQSYTITDVAPVMFLLTDAAATYTEAGGVYTLQLVAMANGASRLPQYSRAADGASIHLDKTPNSTATVKQALDELFRVIRHNYRHHYDCVIAVAEQKKIANPTERFYPVEYEVQVEDIYGTTPYILSDTPEQYKTQGGNCAGAPAIKNKPGGSIEDAIHRIMSMCPQVKRDMVDGDGGGPNAIKYEYKIHSTVEPIKDGDTKRTVVRYYIQRYMSPRGFNVQQLLSGGDGSILSNQLRENLIEFDYIFTGKNIDILEFNIQMNYGLSYLQTAATSNSFKEQFEAVASRSRHVSMYSDQSSVTGEPLPIPVFFSPQLRGLSTTNTADPSMSAQAGWSMAKHASVEVAEASVKIVGNPRLYSSIVSTTHPSKLGVKIKTESHQDAAGAPKDTPTLENADFKYWSQLPALAVINIMMPADNDDVGLMAGSPSGDNLRSPDYATRFWYDGYYYVYGVENQFMDGEFTQQLLMVAIPNGSLLENGKLKSDTEKSVATVGDCYTSLISKNPATTQTQATVPSAPTADATSVPVTNKRDADSANKMITGTPSKVAGWSKAPDSVKQAIDQVSASSGIDSTLLAQMAQIESTFNPSAANPLSNAVGLYQFVPKTWMNLVKRGLIEGIPPNTPEQVALAKRTDPLYSTRAAAALLKDDQQATGAVTSGDLYLQHMFGRSTSKSIFDAVNSGRGGYSLSQVIGYEQANKILNANPQLKGKDVGGIRDWGAMRVAQAAPSGVKPVSTMAATQADSTGTKQPPTPKAPYTPAPTDGKTARETVAELAGAAASKSEKAAAATPDNPCGTKEPPTDADRAWTGSVGENPRA